MRTLGLTLVLFAAIAAHAPAQVAPDPRSDNAAARYMHWMPRIDPSYNQRVGMIESAVPKFKAIKGPKGPMATPAEIRATLKHAQPVIRGLIDAGAIENARFDFKPNTDGPEGKTGQQIGNQMVAAAKLLHADACRAWQDGDAEGTADRLVALIGMSRHLMHGTALDSLSTVHGAGLLELALTSLAEFETAGQPLTGVERERILEALARFPDEDPFSFRRSWAKAWRESSDRLDRQLKQDEIDRAVILAVWEVRARSLRTESRLGLPRTKGKVPAKPPELEVMAYRNGHRLGVQMAGLIEAVWIDDEHHVEMENMLAQVNEDPSGFAVGVVGLFFDAYERNLKLTKRIRAFVEGRPDPAASAPAR